MGFRMENRSGIVVVAALNELGMMFFLGLVVDGGGRCLFRREYVVRAQVKRAQNIEADFAVETKAIEANGRDLLAMFVESDDLQNC